MHDIRMLFYDCLLFLDLKLQAFCVICSSLDRYPALGHIRRYHNASPRSPIHPKPRLLIAYSIRIPFLAIHVTSLFELDSPQVELQLNQYIGLGSYDGAIPASAKAPPPSDLRIPYFPRSSARFLTSNKQLILLCLYHRVYQNAAPTNEETTRSHTPH
jgi:hypothetical protein